MNKNFKYQGKFYYLTELAKMHDKSVDTVRCRIQSGMSLEEALTTPLMSSKKPVEYKGKKYESKVAFARALGCDRHRFSRIGKRYDSIEDAIPMRNRKNN